MSPLGSLLVALSGGVDSAVLLSLAVDALGVANVVAVTGQSASLPAADLDDARRVAEQAGVPHEVVATFELNSDDYRANRGDRCFHCRTELFRVMQLLSERFHGAHLAYGAIIDDQSDDRPGMHAAKLQGVLAPLLDAGIGKQDVRQIARVRGLTVADRPAAACLASRIPVGTEVTSERLRRVERAESALRRLGFRRFRVRHHGELARLELDREGQELMNVVGISARVTEVLKSAGFDRVVKDPAGYRGELVLPGPPVGLKLIPVIGPNREGGQ